MEVVEQFNQALDYIERHLTDQIEYSEIAKAGCCSQYHFQRMFSFLAGIPLSEYIRRRRLTMAALDLQNSDEMIITIADRYGYRSPDSFTKAFQFLHHITPSAAREKGMKLKAYPRISISLSLKGVLEMNYRIEEKKSFRVVGKRERFLQGEALGEQIGLMWKSIPDAEMNVLMNLSNDVRSKIPYGLYVNMYSDNTTDYYIASPTASPCPENFEELVIEQATWAVFEVTGALPSAIAENFQRIYTEWFPTSGYEQAEIPEIEWYSMGDMSSPEYECELWIPIKKK